MKTTEIQKRLKSIEKLEAIPCYEELKPFLTEASILLIENEFPKLEKEEEKIEGDSNYNKIKSDKEGLECQYLQHIGELVDGKVNEINLQHFADEINGSVALGLIEKYSLYKPFYIKLAALPDRWNGIALCFYAFSKYNVTYLKSLGSEFAKEGYKLRKKNK